MIDVNRVLFDKPAYHLYSFEMKNFWSLIVLSLNVFVNGAAKLRVIVLYPIYFNKSELCGQWEVADRGKHYFFQQFSFWHLEHKVILIWVLIEY